ncbi:MAG: DUF4405 domain-containing protein [Desulfobacter sp.]|nr:MAG: DUF4405 domain-containing protein [Desulfobacter sp.]
MKIRRITSLTAGLAFIVMVITSFILYIVPQGRIAYWADWKLLGLTKEQWGNIHINTGILFLMALGLHIYYNWNPILTYLKDKARQIKIFTADFNAAFILTIVVVLGTYAEIPPFSSILSVSESIKDKAAREYGEPPYGHAELSSLELFAKKTGLPLGESLARLKEKGIKVAGKEQTLSEIARNNALSPQKVYLAMKPETARPVVPVGTAIKLPGSPPPGTGNMTLAALCSQYNLNMKAMVRTLADRGLKARENQTIKDIATENQTGPMDIYDHIRTAAGILADQKS